MLAAPSQRRNVPPPIVVGDQVEVDLRRPGRKKLGLVIRVNGMQLTVQMRTGEERKLSRHCVRFYATQEQIEESKELIRRSWKDLELRRDLFLPIPALWGSTPTEEQGDFADEEDDDFEDMDDA